MSLEHHNRVLRAGEKRALELEGRFIRVLTPILEQAGRLAASAFTANATNHLTAAAHRRADRDALARLPRDARRPLVLTAAVDVQPTSTMICVKPRPDEAAALADPDGYPAENLHCTLVYLGELDGDLTPVLDALRGVAGTHAALAGIVGGYGQFGRPDGSSVGILLPDVPGLVELRVAVAEALTEAGIDYDRGHGFEAHLTVDPDPEPGELEEMLPLSGSPLHFDELLLVRGDTEIHPLPLVGVPPITASAGGIPDWSAPAPAELIDVDALVSRLRTKTDPVRRAVVASVMKPGLAAVKEPPQAASMLAELRRINARVRAGEDRRNLLTAAESALERLVKGGWLTNADRVDVIGSWVSPAFHPNDVDLLVSVSGNLTEQQRGLMKAVTGQAPSTEAERHPFSDDVHVLFTSPNDPEFNTAMADRYRKDTERRYDVKAESLYSRATAAAGISFDVSNPLVARVLAQTGSQIVDIAETTQANVMRIISAAYDQGLTIPDTAKAIRVGMTEAAGVRATLIARTELAGAVNGGSLAATQIVQNETGTTYLKKWMTASGAKYPRHEDYEGLDGQTVALDATFDVGGAQMQHPGDPDGPADEICNCRCAMSYTDEAE